MQTEIVTPGARVLEVRTGRIADLGGVRTAYAKARRDGRVRAGRTNLEGDDQADRKHHGGPDKAVYAYAASAYPLWRAERPHHEARLVPGGFGENLVIDGLDETRVQVGDRWRMGTALIEPCQPRQPCHVLARWFGDPAMVRALIDSRRTGWYCRVIEEGDLAAGDACVLEDRIEGNFSIVRLAGVIHAKRPDRGDLALMVAMRGLAAQWQEWALGRLALLPPEERAEAAPLSPGPSDELDGLRTPPRRPVVPSDELDGLRLPPRRPARR